MRTQEQDFDHAADLYWLAYLLTGDRTPSADLTLEVLDLEDDAGAFFSTWMVAWSRRIVVSKALAAIRGELAASAARTRALPIGKNLPAPGVWRMDPAANKIQLERALLAIDVFPRCAVVLSIFERVSVENAAVLLDCDVELVRKGQIVGLRELIRNLARFQAGEPAAADPVVWKCEWQHA